VLQVLFGEPGHPTNKMVQDTWKYVVICHHKIMNAKIHLSMKKHIFV
jgi:hypothetical protein